jgi:hypothetical protein
VENFYTDQNVNALAALLIKTWRATESTDELREPLWRAKYLVGTNRRGEALFVPISRWIAFEEERLEFGTPLISFRSSGLGTSGPLK